MTTSQPFEMKLTVSFLDMYTRMILHVKYLNLLSSFNLHQE